MIQGFEPTDMTARAANAEPDQADHFAPSDYDQLAAALPELERIPGISREWVEWYEGLTARMGRATGATDAPEEESGHE